MLNITGLSLNDVVIKNKMRQWIILAYQRQNVEEVQFIEMARTKQVYRELELLLFMV